jgi:hypothetical protein
LSSLETEKIKKIKNRKEVNDEKIKDEPDRKG